MRAVVQRVSEASVTVGGVISGQIERGFLILVGISQSDTEREALWMAQKIAKLRIFETADKPTGATLSDAGGNVLLVSQFTLYGSVKGNNRPSFIEAARPDQAEALYLKLGAELEQLLQRPTSYGVFGAMMDVRLSNDGPFTILIDTATDMPAQSKSSGLPARTIS